MKPHRHGQAWSSEPVEVKRDSSASAASNASRASCRNRRRVRAKALHSIRCSPRLRLEIGAADEALALETGKTYSRSAASSPARKPRSYNRSRRASARAFGRGLRDQRAKEARRIVRRRKRGNVGFDRGKREGLSGDSVTPVTRIRRFPSSAKPPSPSLALRKARPVRRIRRVRSASRSRDAPQLSRQAQSTLCLRVGRAERSSAGITRLARS